MRSAHLLALVLVFACTAKSDDDTGAAADTGATDPAPTEAGESTGGTTGADPGAALDAACEAYCAVYDACPDAIPGECLGICLGSIVDRCVDEGVAYLECVADQTCDTLMNGAAPCAELDQALDDGACFRICEGVTVEPGPACALEIQCTEEPLQRVDCGPDGCTCTVEGVVVKTCPEGFCTPEDQLPSENCCDDL